MPTKANVTRPIPSKAELLTWARDKQKLCQDTQQHLTDLAHGDNSERELFARLVKQAMRASYELGGIHADLTEGRHS